MSEEIKEIYQDDEELIVRYKDGTFRTFNDLTIDVLNYITNLQQRVEQLEKENQKLKKAVKEKVIATCNTCEDYGICPHSYREYDLENIRKEAIKLIKEDACYDEDWNRCCDDLSLSVCDEVLNILNKGSE